MATYYVNGSPVIVKLASAKKGGEADVYEIGGGNVLKIYKTSTHADLAGKPHEQKSAAKRLELQQQKLPAFPHNLPKNVIGPNALATDKSGSQIVGYTMPFIDNAVTLLKLSDPEFRLAGYPANDVCAVFRNIHASVSGIHRAGVVLGDFNDLNVLVREQQGFFIDADSYQYGGFPCLTFTNAFVDPTLTRVKTGAEKNESMGMGSLMLAKPHTPDSDWYAFAVMLMQSFLYVHPYGGVLRAKDASRRVVDGERPIHGITVFDDDVKYPKPAIPYDRLPDDLLQYFLNVFHHKVRGVFPQPLIDGIRWTICSKCGTEYARGRCPVCFLNAPAAIREVRRGTVLAKNIARTQGPILHATVQGGKLLWLYHENGKFIREDGSVVSQGELNPQLRYRILGKKTLIATKNLLLTFNPPSPVQQTVVESYEGLALFDVNENTRFWIDNGQLLRDGELGGSFHIGDVLSGQTLFRVGPTFGFGFYRAGGYNVSFVFDAIKGGILDSVKLAPIQGQLLGTTSYFTKDLCWFFVTSRHAGQTVNRCAVIRRNGEVLAEAEALQGDQTWLGTIGGKCVAGSFLLAPTDEGIVRIEIQNGQLVEAKAFPDTEPFVSSDSNLFFAPNGIYVQDRKEIRELQIS